MVIENFAKKRGARSHKRQNYDNFSFFVSNWLRCFQLVTSNVQFDSLVFIKSRNDILEKKILALNKISF